MSIPRRTPARTEAEVEAELKKIRPGMTMHCERCEKPFKPGDEDIRWVKEHAKPDLREGRLPAILCDHCFESIDPNAQCKVIWKN